MSTDSLMTRIRPGMQVQTVDGHLLGTVTRVWFGRDPSANSPHCDDECCSRIEVQRARMLTRQVRYVPLNAIAAVTVDHVTLALDAATVDERDWTKEPAWIVAALLFAT